MDNRTYFQMQYAQNRDKWMYANSDDSKVKILYMNHNLKNNYMNANGSGDTKMKKDILMSEVAKLIVNRPDKVAEHLRKAGYKISGRPSQRQLVKYTSDALHGSKKFATLIAKDIVGNGENYSVDYGALIDTGVKAGAEAGKAQPAPPKDWGAILGGASGVVSGLGGLFGGKKKAQADTAKAKAEAEAAKAEAAKALAEAAKGVRRSKGGGGGDNTGLYIGIAVAVAVVVVAGIIFMVIRARRKS